MHIVQASQGLQRGGLGWPVTLCKVRFVTANQMIAQTIHPPVYIEKPHKRKHALVVQRQLMQNLLSTPLTLAEFKPTVLWPNFYFYQKTIGRQYDQNGISHLANSAVTNIFLFGSVPFGGKHRIGRRIKRKMHT